ncbi:hypothetical protein GCM10007898_27990 [Dyella flagellata]|uniref:Uncharacterized protein n=1 Tax=Dyella flagellata TaxID=1867833 RepID=A0ABQ5XCN7_9GAMM|nr:hypothetical protein GCM10007898_27990 [Dyella flagellata]
MRALGPFAVDDGAKRFDPFLGFGGVEILVENVVELIHETSPRRSAPPLRWVRVAGAATKPRQASVRRLTPARDLRGTAWRVRRKTS